MTDDTTGTETPCYCGRPKSEPSAGCIYHQARANTAAPTEARGLGERVAALAEIIWHTSRADEGTISATGANIVARALLDAGYTPGDSLACCPECGSVFETEDNTVVCDHAPEVSAKRLAEAAAPETEGPVAPCSRKDAHDPHEHWDVPASEPGEYRDAHICRGIEPFPTAEPLTAQPAAEGAREDDGLDDATSATVQFDCGVCRATQDYCDTSPDGWCCDGCCSLIGAAHGDEFTDWLAEDRRRARAEGGAGALEEAAEDVDLDMGKGYTGGDDAWATNVARQWLRDRAAGMRETGGKG